MSDADSTSRRRPPTIDLTAKEVASSGPDPRPDSEAASPQSKPEPVEESAASAGETPPDVQAGSSTGRAARYVVGAVVGVIGAAAIAAALWFAGVLPVQIEPAPQSAAAPPRTEAAPGTSPVPATQTASTVPDEISGRLDRIEQALQGPPRTDAALAGRVAGAEAQAKALNDSLAALTRRVDELAGAAQTAVAQAKSAADAAKEAVKNAAASTQQSSVQRSDIEAVESRVAALQTAMKSLEAALAQRASSTNADDRVMRLAIAAEALRATVERGAPFAAELAAVKTLGADPKATTALEPLAAQGLISTAVLVREFTALVPALDRATEPPTSDTSLWAALESRARRLVRITPVDAAGQPAGNDPAALIARLKADVARGDIDGALAEIAKLPDEARALAQAWADKAAARQAALAEGRRISAEALSTLARPESR
jgi:inner membrane protein